MVWGQVSLYQGEIPEGPEGAVKVCEMLLSPLVGLVAPSCAHQLPPWQPELTAVSDAPAAVQPESEPLSNPPLTRARPPLLPVWVRAEVAAWGPEAAGTRPGM